MNSLDNNNDGPQPKQNTVKIKNDCVTKTAAAVVSGTDLQHPLLPVKELQLNEIVPRLLNVSEFNSAKTPAMAQLKATHPRYSYVYEVAVFTQDGGTAIIDDCRYPIKKGDIRIHRPGQIVSTVLHYECYTVRFTLDDSKNANSFQTNYRNKFIDALPPYMPSRSYEAYIRLFREMLSVTITDPDGAELILRAKMFELLYMLYSDATLFRGGEKPSRHVIDVITSATDFISDHYGEHLTLEKISRQVNHSPNYFHRLFKEVVKMSPTQYLMKVRLDKAKELLTITSLTIFEISEECGFESPAYFTSVFKKNTGLTPGFYRKSRTI